MCARKEEDAAFFDDIQVKVCGVHSTCEQVARDEIISEIGVWRETNEVQSAPFISCWTRRCCFSWCKILLYNTCKKKRVHQCTRVQAWHLCRTKSNILTVPHVSDMLPSETTALSAPAHRYSILHSQRNPPPTISQLPHLRPDTSFLNQPLSIMEDLQMEHGFLKAPWEVLVRTFRAGHKPLAKEVDCFTVAVSQLIQETSNIDQASTSIPPESIQSIQSKLTGLKRKLEVIRSNEDESMQRCFCRIRHLRTRRPPSEHFNGQVSRNEEGMRIDSRPGAEVETENGRREVDPASVFGAEREAEDTARWEKMRLDRALVDYMLREGMYETAESLAKSQSIEQIVDTDIFRESRVVIEALRKRDCSEGLRWCNENKRRLQKVQSKLEFRLRLQEFVEHARAGRKEDAIKYMKKHLSAGTCDEERMCDIQRFMALLAFDPTTSCQPYKDMYSERKWLELELAFKQDNYKLHGLTRESTIEIMLKAGLASLKTRKCGTEADRKPNCPTCVEPYLSLAQSLPRGRHENSILVCSISGEIMDENNPPMALPNGNVYSLKALTKLAEKNNGTIVDPRNQDKTQMKDLAKCFIM